MATAMGWASVVGLPAAHAAGFVFVHPIADQTVDEGQVLTVDVTVSDECDRPITLQASNVPNFGSFVDNGDGTGQFTFSPEFSDDGSYADITATATAFDNGDTGCTGENDTTGSTSFTLTVNNVNRSPVAHPGSVSTSGGTAAPVTLMGSDPDGDPLTFSVASGPGHGSLSGTAPDLTYTPALGFAGPDSFTFCVSDGHLTSESATESITVNDRVPVLTGVADVSVNEGTSRTMDVSAVDPDGQDVTITTSTLPDFVTFADDGAGKGTFTIAPGFDAAGAFPITVVAAATPALAGDSTSQPFTLTVVDVNRAPTMSDLNLATTQDTPVTIHPDATDADGNAVSFLVLTQPSHGTLSTFTSAAAGRVRAQAVGSVTYTPAAGFVGTDSFTFAAFDGTAQSAPATATIAVTPLGAPVALADSATTEAGVAVVMAVLANDSEPGGGHLSVVIPARAEHGRLQLLTDGTVVYSPDPGFTGTDVFSYQACNLATVCAAALDTVTVVPPTVVQGVQVSPTAPTQSTPSASLPFTGASTSRPFGIAFALVALGGLLLFLAGRNQHGRHGRHRRR